MCDHGAHLLKKDQLGANLNYPVNIPCGRKPDNTSSMSKYQSKMIRLRDWTFETKLITVCDSLFGRLISMGGLSLF